ncbi:MAG: DNA polymerase IV [Patescibacteria group bacterium]|nr:DNA polymerase IV [Patescibacteria group bacterium]
MEKIILHVDLNSFFASAAQQNYPFLRGKPVGIIKAFGRTCVIANSNEAKKFGVKTGMSLSQVKTLCPQIILMPADFSQYAAMTKKFIKLMDHYSDQVEVFSLDEVFLDVTYTAHLFGGSLLLAYDLQARLKQTLGDWMNCSVGIAKNKFLAKLASGMAPKKSVYVVTKDNQQKLLAAAPFAEVCGIGFRLTQRLKIMGINSLPKILAAPDSILRAEFGSFWSLQLKRLARGEDHSSLITSDQLPDAKSVSRTYTLFKNTCNPIIIKALIRNLVEEACFKLRCMGLVGRQFGLSLRGDGFSQSSYVTRKTFTDSGRQVFRELYIIYNSFHWPHPVRFLGIWISLLARKKYLPRPLFLNDQKQERILQTMDQINQTYGDYTIYPATLINQTIIRPEINGFMGDKKFQLFDKPN